MFQDLYVSFIDDILRFYVSTLDSLKILGRTLLREGSVRSDLNLLFQIKIETMERLNKVLLKRIPKRSQ